MHGKKFRAGLTALLALTGLALPPAAPASAASTITVNLADSTGPVFHGASGALYGRTRTSAFPAT